MCSIRSRTSTDGGFVSAHVEERKLMTDVQQTFSNPQKPPRIREPTNQPTRTWGLHTSLHSFSFSDNNHRLLSAINKLRAQITFRPYATNCTHRHTLTHHHLHSTVFIFSCPRGSWADSLSFSSTCSSCQAVTNMMCNKKAWWGVHCCMCPPVT